jgi:hypothetical protein
MPSPTVELNSTSLGAWTPMVNGVNVAAGEVVSVRLADSAGVKLWQLSAYGVSDQTTFPAITQATTPGGTATFTAPASPATGWALIFQTQIGVNVLGKDLHDQAQTSYTDTFGVYLLTTAGGRVGATNETDEGSAAFGWVTKLNDVARAAGTTTTTSINTVRVPWKGTARAVSTSNITLSGTQTIDGVACGAGDRVLVAGQTTGANNGIYVVAAGAWARAADMAVSADCIPGSTVTVSEGSFYQNSTWLLITPAPITLGSTALSFLNTADVLDIRRAGIVPSVNTSAQRTLNRTRLNALLALVVNGLAIHVPTGVYYFDLAQLHFEGLSGVHFYGDGDNATQFQLVPDILDASKDHVFTADAATDTCTSAAHGWLHGDTINVSNSGGGLPAGLAAATNYRFLKFSADTFKLVAYSGWKTAQVTGDATANTLKRTAHGFVNGDVVQILSGTQLGIPYMGPGGLAMGTNYFVVTANTDDFQLSLTSGGAAIDLTTAGTGVSIVTGGAPINITTNGTGTQTAKRAAAAIDWVRFAGCSKCNVERITFYGQPGGGPGGVSSTGVSPADRMLHVLAAEYNACSTSVFKNCRFQGGKIAGVHVGSGFGTDTNVDLMSFEECWSQFNDGIGYKVTDNNTSGTTFWRCHGVTNGEWGVQCEVFPRETSFMHCRIEGTGVLAANRKARFRVERTFAGGEWLYLWNMTLELANSEVFLSTEPGGGGQFAGGGVLVHGVNMSNNNPNGVRIFDCQAPMYYELHNCIFAGNGTDGVCTFDPVAATSGGARTLFTRGVTLHSGATFSVRETGTAAMRWDHGGLITMTNLTDTAPTEMTRSVVRNVDVSSVAGERIAGSKVSPDFGSQILNAGLGTFTDQVYIHNGAGANTLELIVRRSAGQTVNQQEWQEDTSGAAFSAVGPQGHFLGPDGAVATPGFAFLSDPNTGMYRSGADVLDLAMGGAIGAELSAPADGQTALLLRRNVGGSFTLQRVSMGAADSGGAGFKVLRVPN